MASVAICTAVWNPNVTSVPTMSLSIVFGTPTIGSPCSAWSWQATLSEPLPPMTMSASRPRSAIVAATSSTPRRRVERAAPLGAEHRAAARQRAAHRLDRQRHRAPLAHAVPGVEEADELVAVDPLALAHDGPDHGVQTGAVAATGEDADSHRAERRASPACRRRAINRRRGMGRQPTGAVAPARQGVGDLRRRSWPSSSPSSSATANAARRSSPACSSAARCTSALGYVLAKFGYQRKTLGRAAHAAGGAVERVPPTTQAAAPSGPPGADAAHLDAVRTGPTEAAQAPMTLRHRHRRRHDRHPQPGRVHRRSPGRRRRTASSPSTSRSPGWVEHDAAEIWDGRAGDAARRRRAGRRRRRWRRSASPTSARRSSPGTARPGSRYGRAIVWQDRRTAARCDELAAAGALDLVRERTGLVLDPYFSGTKFEWLLARGRRARRPTTSRSARSTPG